MDDFEKELILDFFAEANQLIESTEQTLLLLEKDQKNINHINEIFRLAHTIKGSSRAVGFGQIAEFTHEVENLIMQMQKGKLAVTSPIITMLLESNDFVRVMIDNLTVNYEATFDTAPLIAKIKATLPK